MSRPSEREALYARINEGLALYPARPFEAHERWEEAWLALPSSDERALLRVLIQVAAARVKEAQGNARGLEKNLEKAARGIAGIDVDVGALLGLDLWQLRATLAAGRLPRLPTTVHRRGILYLHGFASGPTSAKAAAFGRALADVPLSCPDLNLSQPSQEAPEPRFDFFGLSVPRALHAARRCLFEETVIVGSSMGGYLAALLGADPRVRALVLMAPAFDFSARLLERHGAEAVGRWRQDGFTLIDHHQTHEPERLGPEILEPHGLPAFPPVLRPTYILHGLRDETVPPALSQQVSAQAPLGLVELELVDDDHGLERSVDRAIDAARRAWAQARD